MARGINKVILIGHLGRDPETRSTQDGVAITNVTVATSETWKDKQSGEKQEHTEWHRVVMYRRLAEIASEYLKKGSKVYIEGKLRTRKWQDKTTGADRYSTEIIADDMQMLDSKSDVSGRASYDVGSSTERQETPSVLTVDEQFDDDIPF